MTKREQILTNLASNLTSLSGVGSIPVFRSHVEPFSRNKLPAIVIEPRAESSNQVVTDKIDWSLDVKITVVVRGEIPDQIADPIVNAIHAKLSADPQVNSLAIDTNIQSIQFEFADSDQPTGIISMDYNILYRTNTNNLSI